MKHIILLTIAVFICGFSYPQILEQDSLALVDLYYATDGPNWEYSSNWLVEPVSEWFGIYTSENRVTEIILSDNDLHGELPSSIGNITALELLCLCNNQLYGSIPDEITNLSHLKTLYIFDNLYSDFPVMICAMDSLIRFNASYNLFEGEIPDEVFNMPNLEELNLSYNSFSGELPPIIGMDSLKSLSISNNMLTGEIPMEIFNCTNLTQLTLKNNYFTGQIPPEIGNLINLTGISVSNNMLYGELPDEINNLTKLWSFHVNNNNFSGSVPPIPDLDELEWLSLKFNNFDGMPDFTENDSLKVLRISDNNLTFEDIEPYANNNFTTFECAPQDSVGEKQTITIVQGVPISFSVEVGGTNNKYQWYKFGEPIPGANDSIYTILNPQPWDAGIYTCDVNNLLVPQLTIFRRPVELLSEDSERNALIALYLSTNGDGWDTATNWLSSAPLCDWYGIDTINGHVSAIRLPRNHLTGTIPQEIGDLDSLQLLDFHVNNISGEIPESISNLTNLKFINLSYNQLDENPLPLFAQMPELEVIRLRSNYFGGTIPEEFGNLINLKELCLQFCALENPIPISFFNLTNLEYLEMGGNNFTGSFPSQILNLSSLKHFDIWNGEFEGNILSLLVQLPSLEYINISANNFTGQIPTQISNLVNLKEFFIKANDFGGQIPVEMGSLTSLEKAEIGGNFTGTIPSSFQNLVNLTRLSVNNTQLSGAFPISICGLPELKYLYLGHNEFSGPLPSEIGNFPNLSLLNLKNNNFTVIPPEIGLLDSLFILDLSSNEISSLPVEIGNMNNLSSLLLASNNLDSIPVSFSNLSNLKKLELQNNDLTSFNIDIDSMPEFNILSIYYNYLTFESIEPYVNKIEYFSYGGQELIGEDTYIDIQVGDTLNIYVDIGGEYNEYQWYFNGWPIPGANSSNYTLNSITQMDFGVYFCIITNSLATELTLVSYDFYVGETNGFEEQRKQDNIRVFPNPARNILHISYPNEFRPEEIRFYDITGNEVLRIKPFNDVVDISKLTPGLYTLGIVSYNRIIKRKVIITRE